MNALSRLAAGRAAEVGSTLETELELAVIGVNDIKRAISFDRCFGGMALDRVGRPTHQALAKPLAVVSLIVIFTGLLVASGCTGVSSPSPEGEPSRESSIPESAVRVLPDVDIYPPALHSEEWEYPIPLPGPVNTAGVEDAPVISRDGTTLLFFFTPDGNVSPNEQLFDGVTGVWWCTKRGESWTNPVRVRLSDDLALDGPIALQDNTLWFASFRVGNHGAGDVYTAELSDGEWSDWHNAGQQLNLAYDVGELYATADGNSLYFGRTAGSFGESDLWVTTRSGDTWSEPVNLGAPVNTIGDESRPFISSDGRELWFTRMVSGMGYAGPAIFRSIRTGDKWSEPEEIVSNFVGDPGLDDDGNLYFTHLFYDAAGEKLETDIYVAYRR